jgi:CTP-dependent riboflavin kinase
MAGHLKISGKIISGGKQGAFFTQLNWVREQCLQKLGFAPWPGTLNLEIAMDFVDVIEELKEKNGIELISPDANFCSGHVLPVSLEEIAAAIVIPAEDVRVHAKNIIEIIAPEMLKTALEVNDGDWVTLTINDG